MAVYLLTKDNPAGVDPLAPANKLIFCLGPVTDSRINGSCRHGVFTKSPLTGVFSGSYAGGRLAEPMSRVGYDASILEETSVEQVWLEISDQKVVFHDAKALWGKDTYSTEDEVLKQDEKELRDISSRIQEGTRKFSLPEGLTPKDDMLPKRFFDEPLGKDGKILKREDFQKMIQDYYALRNWSAEGVPKT